MFWYKYQHPWYLVVGNTLTVFMLRWLSDHGKLCDIGWEELRWLLMTLTEHEARIWLIVSRSAQRNAFNARYLGRDPRWTTCSRSPLASSFLPIQKARIFNLSSHFTWSLWSHYFSQLPLLRLWLFPRNIWLSETTTRVGMTSSLKTSSRSKQGLAMYTASSSVDGLS